MLFPLTIFLAVVPAHGGEIGHYAPGVRNIRDFFVPERGWYFTVYNVYYNTDVFRDERGNEIRSITIAPGPGVGFTLGLDVDVDVLTIVPTIIVVAPWELPGGGRYGAYISPTVANNSVGASLTAETGAGLSTDEGQFGAGDLYVQPIWLGWSGDHWDYSLSYGFYAPVGKHATDKVDFPLLGITWILPRRTTSGWGSGPTSSRRQGPGIRGSTARRPSRWH